jgi:hypothetical protein
MNAIGMRLALKRSMRVMARQISSAGGWLADSRSHFHLRPGRTAARGQTNQERRG